MLSVLRQVACTVSLSVQETRQISHLWNWETSLAHNRPTLQNNSRTHPFLVLCHGPSWERFFQHIPATLICVSVCSWITCVLSLHVSMNTFIMWVKVADDRDEEVRASSVSPRSSAYTPRACYPYCSMAQRPGPSYKPTGINWIHFMYGANDASCTSDGTTSYLTTKSCIVPACSTSSTSFASEDWVSLGTSPDFDAMYQQTRSYESAPSQGMVSGLRRSGDVPVADRGPPGPTRSAATRV